MDTSHMEDVQDFMIHRFFFSFLEWKPLSSSRVTSAGTSSVLIAMVGAANGGMGDGPGNFSWEGP